MTDRVRLVVPIDGPVAVIKRWRPDAGHYEHTILPCRAVGSAFGTGTGEEYHGSGPEHRGTYEPALVAVDELAAIGLLPAWAVDAVPGWLS